MDASKAQHAPETVAVKLLADRAGWFWPEPLYAGQTYDLPVDVAAYLVGLGVAVLVPPAEPTEAPAADSTPKRKR